MEIKEGSEQRCGEGMRCSRALLVGEGTAMGLRSTRGHGGDAQGIAGQLAARAGALSLSPRFATSAGPDSNPFEGLVALREC